jgi:uncharacterized delta-60 repeat protein
LARYNQNGSLDTSFSSTGKVTTSFGVGDDCAYGEAIEGNGKIVVAGYGTVGQNTDFALARYNPNGSLDASFNGNGKVTTAMGVDSVATSIVIGGNGKIVVAGTSYMSSGQDFALARYDQNGSLDGTFGSTGKIITPLGADADAQSVAIDSNGKIVVAGDSSNSIALARYQGDVPLPSVRAITLVGRNSVAGILTYQVVFSAPVTGLDGSYFRLTTVNLPQANILGVTGAGNTYTVTVSTGKRSGRDAFAFLAPAFIGLNVLSGMGFTFEGQITVA